MKTIPDTIKIKRGDEVIEFSIAETPELKSLVEEAGLAAAQVEKAKLYGEINQLKTELAAKATTPSSTQPNPQTTPASTTQAHPNQVVTPENLREVLNQMMDEKFTKTLPELLQKFVDPLRVKAESLEQENITNYKAQRVKELGETVVPELVTGSTKAEVEASIEVSKLVRARYLATPTPAPVPAPAPAVPAPAPVAQAAAPVAEVPVPAAPPAVQFPSDATPDVKGMSDKEFAEKRDELRKKLTGQLAGYPGL